MKKKEKNYKNLLKFNKKLSTDKKKLNLKIVGIIKNLKVITQTEKEFPYYLSPPSEKDSIEDKNQFPTFQIENPLQHQPEKPFVTKSSNFESKVNSNLNVESYSFIKSCSNNANNENGQTANFLNGNVSVNAKRKEKFDDLNQFVSESRSGNVLTIGKTKIKKHNGKFKEDDKKAGLNDKNDGILERPTRILYKNPLNTAFSRLKQLVPRLPSDKLSKIHTIRLATHYIDFLYKLAQQDD